MRVFVQADDVDGHLGKLISFYVVLCRVSRAVDHSQPVLTPFCRAQRSFQRRQALAGVDPELTLQTGLSPVEPTRGKRVVIVGAGPMGLFAAMDSWLAGAASVTLLEKRTGYTRQQLVTVEALKGPDDVVMDVQQQYVARWGWEFQVISHLSQ